MSPSSDAVAQAVLRHGAQETCMKFIRRSPPPTTKVETGRWAARSRSSTEPEAIRRAFAAIDPIDRRAQVGDRLRRRRLGGCVGHCAAASCSAAITTADSSRPICTTRPQTLSVPDRCGDLRAADELRDRWPTVRRQFHRGEPDVVRPSAEASHVTAATTRVARQQVTYGGQRIGRTEFVYRIVFHLTKVADERCELKRQTDSRCPDSAKPVLLIVDDDASASSGWSSDSSTNQGFEVLSRTGGLPFLAELPHLKPDVALVDLRHARGWRAGSLSRDTRGASDLPRDPDDRAYNGGLGDRSRQAGRAGLFEQAVRLGSPAWIARHGALRPRPPAAAAGGRQRAGQPVRVQRYGRDGVR